MAKLVKNVKKSVQEPLAVLLHKTDCAPRFGLIKQNAGDSLELLRSRLGSSCLIVHTAGPWQQTRLAACLARRKLTH